MSEGKECGLNKSIKKLYYKAFSKFLEIGLWGACFLWGFALYNSQELRSLIAPYITGELASSFLGAVGGSFTVLFIEWSRRQREALGVFNSSIASVSVAINQLILLKKQFALTHLHEIKDIKAKHEAALAKGETDFSVSIKEATMTIPSFRIEVGVPLDRLPGYCGLRPQIFQFVKFSSDAIAALNETIDFKNSIIAEMRENSLPSDQKVPLYLGLASKQGLTDDRLYTSAQAIEVYTDTALAFLQQTVSELDVLAKGNLPLWLRGFVVSLEIVDKSDRALLPPKDFIKGHND